MSGLAEFLSDRDGSDGFRRRRRFLWLPCEDDTQAIAPFRSVEERPSDCLRARGQTRKWSIEWNGIETKQKKRKEKGKKNETDDAGTARLSRASCLAVITWWGLVLDSSRSVLIGIAARLAD